ncbi:MAG: SLBB domain-containing protein [Chitinispirillaceae bacterium]|nr:SLBB domain-containing protein [Chitinispirillaceae bacterium]
MTFSRFTIERFLRSAFGVALLAAGAAGQNFMIPPSTQQNPMTPVNPDGVDYTTLSKQNDLASTDYSARGLIDNSIDDESYCIGGGDIFMISVFDRSTKVIYATINQSGDLFIPQMGTVSIGRKNLREARALIAGYFKATMKKGADPYVSLYRVKTATVSVSGAVNNPGTFELPGTMRIWDAIRAASREFKETSVRGLMLENDLRSVMRRNRDTTDRFDLLSFIYKNDFSQNPYVYPGDEIFLPPVTDRVFIHGEISGPMTGWVPLRVAERAGRFLSLFTLNTNTDTANILLLRKTYHDNGTIAMETFTLSLSSERELRNGDIITIPSRRNVTEVLLASIEGEVKRPGTYPIVKSGTPVKELIAMAGETTPYANMHKAAIVRRSRFGTSAPFIMEGKSSEFGEPLAKVRPELGSALGLMTSTKDYSIIRIQDHPDVFLEPNDHIVIPRAEKMVYLSGNVAMPGGYPFKAGKDKSYYIALAGGMTEKADKSNIYLVAQYGEVRQVFNRDTIEDGDLIVVPISQEYKKLTTIVLPILGATLSMFGLLVGLFATLK